MDQEQLKKRIDLINDAISKNIQSLKFDGNEIVYRSLGEMLKARSILQTELDKKSKNYKSGRRVAVFSRGL